MRPNLIQEWGVCVHHNGRQMVHMLRIFEYEPNLGFLSCNEGEKRLTFFTASPRKKDFFLHGNCSVFVL